VLAAAVDPVITALWSGFDRPAAFGHVEFVGQFWRLGGNPGYDATIDRVRARLVASGFVDAESKAGLDSRTQPSGLVSVEEYPGTSHGWDFSVSTLAIVRPGQPDEVVLSKPTHHIALCINSFSTPPGGIVAPLVDVGRGNEEDYTGKDVTGAVVIGDADPGTLWRRAIAHNAIGVVSTALGAYVSPDPPGAPATPRDQWDILQWGSIPYDEAHHGFGFKASPRAAAALRKGRVSVRVTVTSTFSTKPTRTLVAEIPGRTAAAERIVIAAHVQEPGANDNASGVATLTELARALKQGIQAGKIPPPDRTITFLWLEEIAGSRRWLQDHAADAKQVRYMFSMDMTGEDVKKTGGSFLIERWPDPGAVWDRAWDPHSEWGRGDVRAEQLKGDLINDFHLAICQRVAAKSDWVVKTNPYEGGSDHTVFGTAGVPAVLNWHFTDRYYHSSFDTSDKASPDEMRNVGVSVATSAWLLASANESRSLAVAQLVSTAGQARVALEEHGGVPAAALAAWRKWYGEAVRSVSRLIVGTPSDRFTTEVDQLAGPFASPKHP
jgi:hypothetical protein